MTRVLRWSSNDDFWRHLSRLLGARGPHAGSINAPNAVTVWEAELSQMFLCPFKYRCSTVVEVVHVPHEDRNQMKPTENLLTLSVEERLWRLHY